MNKNFNKTQRAFYMITNNIKQSVKNSNILDDEIEVVQELVNKSVPMKAEILQGHQGRYFKCPKCKLLTALTSTEGEYITQYHCPKKDCNQALDWSNE